MRYLGIDYGKSKLGLGFSDGLIASPFKVMKISGLTDALEKVKSIISKEEVEKVVVGLPESGEARKISENFIKGLSSYIEVIGAEETLSSKLAGQKMVQLGKGKKARRSEDAYSAAIILQEYLDQNNSE